MAVLLLILVAFSVFALKAGTRRDPAQSHTEIEYFAVFFALSIFFLASSKFVATRDAVYLPLSVAFLASAVLDILHAVLRADATSNAATWNLFGYAGWLSRVAVAAGLLVAAAALRRPLEVAHPAQKLWSWTLAAAATGGILSYLSTRPIVPAYFAPGLVLARALETLPFALYAVGFVLLWRQRGGSWEGPRGFGLVATGLGMVSVGFHVASTAAYDAAFFAAHVVESGVPTILLFGLYAEQMNLYKTERRLRETLERAHSEVTQAKRELEAIIDNLNEGLAVADKEGRLVRMNKAGRELLGRDVAGEGPSDYTRAFRVETPQGKPFPQDQHPIVAALRTRRRVGDVEMVVTRPNGERRTIVAGAVPLLDADGELKGAVANFHDISEIRQVEQRYRDLSEQSPDGIIVMDQDGRVRFFNSAAERMFGYPRDEVLGKDVTVLMPTRYHAAHLAARAKRLQHPVPEELKRTLDAHGLRKGGREFPLQVSLTAVRTPTGINFIGNLRDVSALHRSQREREGILSVAQASTTTRTLDEFLRRACAAITATTEFDASTIFLVDTDGRHLTLRASENLPEEILARIQRYPLTAENKALAVQTTLRGKTLIEPHLQARTDLAVSPDLSRKYGFQVVLSTPIRLGNEVLGVLQVIAEEGRHPQEEDVQLLELLGHELALGVSQKNLVDRLEESTNELRRANQELDSFIYTASHDLSEPLRSISNFSHFLMEDYGAKLDEEGLDFLKRVNAGAARMKRLLDDLLRLSRFGRHQAHRERLDLGDLVKEVQESLDASLREKAAEIVVHAPLPEIFADRTSMVEVLANLISNGIKFNEQARPRVEVGAERRNGQVEVFVRDNGIGIPADQQDRIFGLFVRLHARKDYPGTGAGLAIVKKIVETQGGRIWIESSPGRGSTFRFTTPMPDGGHTP